MRSIKNISERNKIDTQKGADAYIRRKRLIIKRDYNLKSGYTYKYFETVKTLKSLSSGQIYIKKTKKKTMGWVLKKNGFLPTLPSGGRWTSSPRTTPPWRNSWTPSGRGVVR
jgi:hypothetical protein